MPVTVNGQTYYRTKEVCQIVGISRNTLFRWMKESGFSQTEYRDWRGWRLFTKAQANEFKAKTNKVHKTKREDLWR